MGKRNEEEMREFKEEMRQEALEDQYVEHKMHTDIEYAKDYLGLDDLVDDINTKLELFNRYGYDLTYADMLEMLGEY